MTAMRIRFMLAIVFTVVLSVTSMLSIGQGRTVSDVCPDGKGNASIGSDESEDVGRWDAFLPGMFK